MSYFATEYTIHFDDTMAYGSHHYLTAFKFQSAARESLLFGQQVYDAPGVRDALNDIQLLTADAYARNINPAKLGERVAILLTLEDWGQASARFCYRIVGEQGLPIGAGYQSLLCVDANTGLPVPLPGPLWNALEKMREIEEPEAPETFRDRVLAGGSKAESLFGPAVRATALQFLAERYPHPQLVTRVRPAADASDPSAGDRSATPQALEESEAWVFAGQGAFDAQLLSERVVLYKDGVESATRDFDQCATVAQQLLGGNAVGLISGSSERCAAAVRQTPALSQVAIHLQNVLGGLIRQAQGYAANILMGHSFGEIAAMGVAGCFDLPTGVRIVCQRAQAISEHAPPGGGLLAVSADRPTVATEINLLGLGQPVVVAGRNHHKQTIISGPLELLDRLKEHLRAAGIGATAVASPTSFHHPGLRTASAAWLTRLRPLSLKGPKQPVYSPIGRRFLSDDDDIAATLASQLLLPFDLQGAVADVQRSGITQFVDCGSTGSLVRILEKAGAKSVVTSRANIDKQEPFESTPVTDTVSSPNPTQASGERTPAPSEHGNSPIAVTADDAPRYQPAPTPPIAIVGQGCLLPGGARTPELLYTTLAEQRMGIVDQRDFDPHWAADFYSEQLVPDRSTSPLMGRVDDDDIVAPKGVDPALFDQLSRSQQLLGVALAPCIASLKGAERIWCLIGATADGFEDHDVVSALRFAGIDPLDPAVDERTNAATAAFRQPHDTVQEVFDRLIRPGLKVVLVDAACASSLYTVALGMQALEQDEADAVIAGGVFCPGPGNSCLFSQFHGTTSTGLRPFDSDADGVVFSEGAALVTLRRLADAEKLALPVSAVLPGVGLSSDGRSSSANVPQTHGQILSLERCYATYGIEPSSIRAIEGHGTSTPVGDSTELVTLQRFFGDHTDRPIPLHSLKGLIGHAGWAAGTASLIAACEYLRHNSFPAQAGFSKPSQTLEKVRDVLTVPTAPLTLPAHDCRVAIDGFGFGGANAHVVVERYLPRRFEQNGPAQVSPKRVAENDDLVFVAAHHVVPTVAAPEGKWFDRTKIELPANHVLLPDLAEDMDISQALAICLVDGVTSRLSIFDDDLRQATSIVLVQRGKTERGVEATLRVLAARFRRDLAGLDQFVEKVRAAHAGARPSGAYTLQCMMPNVSSGRAALRFNLNGPNFVVDGGEDSLGAAFESAELLLRAGPDSGTKLVIVAAIEANQWRISRRDSKSTSDEFAAAFGVTTRRYAEQLGLEVIAPVATTLQSPGMSSEASRNTQTLHDCLEAIGCEPTSEPSTASTSETADCEFALHTPVWVEAPLQAVDSQSHPRNQAVLAVVRANQELVARLVDALPRHSKRHMVVVIGPSGAEVAANSEHTNVIGVDLDEDFDVQTALESIDDFEPDLVVAVESIRTWDLADTLTQVSAASFVCEGLFVVASHLTARMKKGKVELWGMFIDGWNGNVHPSSGAITGMLKAIKRELPAVRVGSICTHGLALDDAFDQLRWERVQRSEEVEVVFDCDTRLVRRLRRTCPTKQPKLSTELGTESVVVATGGARGVTAVMVETLLRDYECTVVAFGRSSPEECPTHLDNPDLERDFYDRFGREHPMASGAEMKRAFDTAFARWETRKTIDRLSSVGGHFEYQSVDVSDPDQVARAIEQVAAKHGRIDLVVHGAGIQLSKRLQQRTLADFRSTYRVKVSGLRNLMHACQQQFGTTVNAHVLTSAYSIFGNDGQHDYGAANETLDRLCSLTSQSDDVTWLSISWLAWAGIGMTRGSEYHALAKQRGLSALTEETGQSLYREVLRGDAPESRICVPFSKAEHVRYGVRTVPSPVATSTGRIMEVGVDISKLECLEYHKVRSTPTLPGAWILDCMVNAAQLLGGGADDATTVVIRDTLFHRFVRHLDGRDPHIRIIVEQTGSEIAVWMIGDVIRADGVIVSKDLLFAQAMLTFQKAGVDLKPSLQEFGEQNGDGIPRVVDDPYCQGHHQQVDLSGPFDCVRDIAIGRAGRRARFAPNRLLHGTEVIPAHLLDSAWRVGAMYAANDKDELYVPVRIGRLVAPLGAITNSGANEKWEIRATAPRVENGCVHSDRTEAFNESGSLKVIVEDAFATPLR